MAEPRRTITQRRVDPILAVYGLLWSLYPTWAILSGRGSIDGIEDLLVLLVESVIVWVFVQMALSLLVVPAILIVTPVVAFVGWVARGFRPAPSDPEAEAEPKIRTEPVRQPSPKVAPAPSVPSTYRDPRVLSLGHAAWRANDQYRPVEVLFEVATRRTHFVRVPRTTPPRLGRGFSESELLELVMGNRVTINRKIVVDLLEQHRTEQLRFLRSWPTEATVDALVSDTNIHGVRVA